MTYIDPTPHPYFKNLAEVTKHQVSGSEISTDYSKKGTWILNYVSFKNGVKVNGPYIALQTEQMDVKGTAAYSAWVAAAQEVWDWADNLWFGYSPVYRLQMDAAKDIDVLFYGELNAKRSVTLTQINNVRTIAGQYGSDIMRFVMRSKIVLSIHYYNKPQNDMPRIAPLLSVGAFVICEKTEDPNFNALSDYLVIVDKKDIPATVAHYLARPMERFAWADEGFDWIRQNPHGLKP